MKRSLTCLFVLALILTACGSGQPTADASLPPTEAPAPTQIPAPTDTPTALPTPTDTPEPTFTLEPSPTPILLPDVINQTFNGVSVVYGQPFVYHMDGLMPPDWSIDEAYAGWVTKDGQFKIKPENHGAWSGTVFYFSKQTITPNEAVYFTFQYTGSAEGFSLGFDGAQSDGQRIKNDDPAFTSVAMEMDGRTLTAHGLQGKKLTKEYFKGNLQLKENTWYAAVIGLDNNSNFIIKVWQPDAPEKLLTYLHNWKNFPGNYYFISWLTAKRTLLIDKFTVFKFDSLAMK